MSSEISIAVAQMCSGENPQHNLNRVSDLVKQGQSEGAKLVCLPENVLYRGPRNPTAFARSELFLEFSKDGDLLETNRLSKAVQEWSSQLQISVSLGSILEKSPDPERPYNTHVIFFPGQKPIRYRKMHLFDFEGVRAQYNESKDVTPGRTPVSFELDGIQFGLSICFDLRFPELYRWLLLEGNVDVLLVPSAFTRETGKDHWHTLLRARAIENLAYVLAPAQYGTHKNSSGAELFCFGHSLVYGPWGELVWEAEAAGESLGLVTVRKEQVDKSRARLGLMASIRRDLLGSKT